MGLWTIFRLVCENLFTLYTDLSLLQRGALDTWRPAFFIHAAVMPDRVIRIGTRVGAAGWLEIARD